MKRNIKLVFLAVLFTLLTACGGGGSGSSVPVTPPSTTPTDPAPPTVITPVAAAISDVTGGKIPLVVKFTDQSTNNPTHWSWKEGGIEISNKREFSFTFTTAGIHVITLTSGNAAGESNIVQITISATAADPVVVAPTADFLVNGVAGNLSSIAPFTVQVSDRSSNATAWIYTYSDGTSDNVANPPPHVYTAAGVYTLSQTAINTGKTATKSVTITVSYPSIKVAGFTVFPESEYTQKITVAFNEDFTLTHPDWKDKAQLYVDHYNALLNRSPGNKRRFVIAQFKTYKNSDLPGAFSSSSYHYDNGYANGIAGGETLFVYMFKNVADIPNYFDNGVGTYTFATSKIFGGKRYNDAFTANNEDLSIFGTVPDSVKTSIPNWYEVMSSYIDHEFGHGDGLALDEWYQYEWDDQSGQLPNLGHYDRRDFYPLDPMDPIMKEGNNNVMLQYSPINSWIINHNADGRYSCIDIIGAVPTTVKVKVLNAQGSPVSGAEVKVFAAVDMQMLADSNNMKSVNLKTLLETPTTNGSGEVLITNDFSQRYSAKGIKVAVGGKYAGLYVTITDLQRAYLMQDLSINTMQGIGLIGVTMPNSDSVTYILQLQ